MSDLIKSITTATISVNDALEEAFEAAVQNTPNNNNLILSYDPDTKIIGKSAFPADAIQLVQDLSASKKTTSVDTDRILTFTSDKTIPQFSASSNVVFTADYTNAKDNCTTTFKILLTNGAVPILPPELEEYAGSVNFINGVVNTVICFRIAGSYGFVNTVLKKDAPTDSNNELGSTTLTTATTTSNTITLSWTLVEAATKYTLQRYLTPNYSDTPVTVYEGSLLAFTDRNLAPTTTYYYQITPKTDTSSGTSSRISATTTVYVPETVPDVIDNNYVAANRLQGTVGATGAFVGNGDWIPAHADDLNKDTYFITSQDRNNGVPYGYWGLDLGTPKVVKTIANVMRNGEPNFNSFVFQGSNTSFTDDMVDLLTVVYGENDSYDPNWIVRRLTNTTAYRFYRFRMLYDLPFSTAEYAMFDK